MCPVCFVLSVFDKRLEDCSQVSFVAVLLRSKKGYSMQKNAKIVILIDSFTATEERLKLEYF